MKKLILLALAAVMMAGCANEKYKVTYKVYWPNNEKVYTVIIDDKPYLGSDRGTNFLKVGNITGSSIIETSAPIDIIRIEKKGE